MHHRWIGLLLVAFGCANDAPPYYIPDSGSHTPDTSTPPLDLDGGAGTEEDDAGIAPSADAGPDASPSEGEEVESFDPQAVYLLGTFEVGACSFLAIEDFDSTTRATAGFDCYARGHRIRSDGAWIYLQGRPGAVGLRRFVPDVWRSRGSESVDYPDDPPANDERLETPECDDVARFRLLPDTGEHVYECQRCAEGVACDGWYREGGAAFPLPDDLEGFWMGHDGYVLVNTLPRRQLALARNGEVLMQVHADVPLDFVRSVPSGLEVRATPTGFDVYTVQSGRRTLFAIGFDGEVSVVGTYPDPPAEFSSVECVIAGDRSLVCFGNRVAGGSDEVVLRYVLGAAAAEVIHDDVDEPRVRIHASSLISGR